MSEGLASWIGAIVALLTLVGGLIAWLTSQIREVRRELSEADGRLQQELARLRDSLNEQGEGRAERLREEITRLDTRWREERDRRESNFRTELSSIQEGLRRDIRNSIYQEPPRNTRVRQS